MAESFSVEAFLKATDSGFVSTFKDAQKQVETFATKSDSAMMAVGDMAKKIGINMSTYFTVPMMALLGLAIKVGGGFEEQMSRVAAISGATGDSFEALKDLAIELGASTAFSATEAAEGRRTCPVIKKLVA